MKLILVPHAEREQDAAKDDCDQGLSEAGQSQVAKLKDFLALYSCVPTRCYTSAWAHARQTAEGLVALEKAISVPVQSLPSLTPFEGPDGLEAFIEQAGVSAFREDDVVLVVAHEPRVSQLLAKMATQRPPAPAYGEATCVQVSSVDVLRGAAGNIVWRGPESDRPWTVFSVPEIRPR